MEEKIQEAVANGYSVCIVDAAVMLSAGWEKNMHEIWVTIAPKKEVQYINHDDIMISAVCRL